MKSICLLICLMSVSLGGLCQMNMKGKIFDRSTERKNLFLYEVHKFSGRGTLVDSIPVSTDGYFVYSVPGHYVPGTLFKITGDSYKERLEFPENALFFIYEKKSSISISIISLSHLYLADYKSDTRTNILVSKLQKMQHPYFEKMENFMKSKQGPGEKEALFADINKFRVSFLQQLLKFPGDEIIPLANVALLYFYCHINVNQLNDSLSIAKFAALELPATDLVESLKTKFGEQSMNAFDKAISNYTLLDSDKNEVALPGLFKAKYTIVDLWASWCPPCRKVNKNEVPKFIEKLKHLKDVEFIAISVDTDSEKWEAAMKDDNVYWKSFLLKHVDKDLPEILNGNGIPYYIIYDQQGKAIYGSGSNLQVYTYIVSKN